MKLNKGFKCPKSIKMMCAGEPKSVWRFHMEAHQVYLTKHREGLKSRKADKDLTE